MRETEETHKRIHSMVEYTLQEVQAMTVDNRVKVNKDLRALEKQIRAEEEMANHLKVSAMNMREQIQ